MLRLSLYCRQQRPLLFDPRLAGEFLSALEAIRERFQMRVYGYVLLPSEAHLLLTEPRHAPLYRAVQALKISTTCRARALHVAALWQRRYEAQTVCGYAGFIEELRRLHRHPLRLGLCAEAHEWPWSSYSHYASRPDGRIEAPMAVALDSAAAALAPPASLYDSLIAGPLQSHDSFATGCIL